MDQCEEPVESTREARWQRGMEKESKGAKRQSHNDQDPKNPDKAIQKGFMSELIITKKSQQQRNKDYG